MKFDNFLLRIFEFEVVVGLAIGLIWAYNL